MPGSPFLDTLEATLPGAFRAAVARHPGRPAVRFDGAEWSYAELLARVRAVAAALGTDGPSGAVAVLAPQGLEQVAAILGVLEAGGWYVPLDPSAAPESVARLLELAEATTVLVTAATEATARTASGNRVRVIRVETCPPAAGDDAGTRASDPEALACVYFTSGTTGAPKGVMDTHRNVAENVARYTRALGWTHEDRLTLVQAPHFSGAVSNLFGALLNGALLLPYDVARDGAGAPLAAWIERERPTVLHAVPSLFRSVCLPGARFPSVRVVRLEGDAGSPADTGRFAAHFAPGARLAHGLGATETGLCCQYFIEHGAREAGDVLPIGFELPGIEIRLLDEDGRPVAAGEAGEIVVRGRRLSPGYWRDPARTASAFRTDPTDSTIREYHTGDLGRRRTDGALEHLGRRDQRLRVRGAWVDAAPVEARIAALPGVREAAVGLLRSGPEEGRLAAWLVIERAPPAMTAVRRAVAIDLPPAAVPARGFVVSALPLGAHAKLDRRSLHPGLGSPLPEGAGADPPRDGLEAALAEIWREVLGLETVGIHDAFVELGGDSLTAAALTLRIEERLGVRLSQSELAESPTVARLGDRLASRPTPLAAMAPPACIPLRVGGDRPPLFCVHDLDSDAFLFSPLARRLGEDQPVYGLRLPEREPARRLPQELSDLAARYVREMRRAAPRGPRALAGFCFGGAVALEMAHQLRAMGEPPALLALLNVTAFDLPAVVSPRARSRFRHRWGARIRYLSRKPGAAAWIVRRLRRAAGDLVARASLDRELARLAPDAVVPAHVMRAALLRGFERHVSRPYPGGLLLFLADETLPLYADDPQEAWAGLATGPLEIHRLPHDGYAMLSEPDVNALAPLLASHLSRIGPAAPRG